MGVASGGRLVAAGVGEISSQAKREVCGTVPLAFPFRVQPRTKNISPKDAPRIAWDSSCVLGKV